LSETPKISSSKIKDWLRKETRSILIPVHEKAEKLLDEMNSEFEKIIDVSEMLLDNSQKEIKKRSKNTYSRARALNKLARLFLKRIRQIEIPEKVSYDRFHDFVQETRKAFTVTEVDIKNWFSRISPFFILDRRKFLGVFEKAKESSKELQSFLTKEYIKTKTIEETFQLVNNLLSMEHQLADLETRKKQTETQKASIERKIVETQKKMELQKNQESLTQINQINMEMKKLSRDVKRNLRHLQKPFIKLQRMVFRKGGLTPEESKKLNHYIGNPFEALTAEDVEYPCLKGILRKMNHLISEGKLKLKRSRELKAKQDIEKILNKDSLKTLHQKCREAATRKKQLSTSTEITNIKGELRELQEILKKLKRRKKRIELEENAVKLNVKETLGKINETKNEIEKNVLNSTGKRILVELQV